ncbi:MAG: LiaF transmembrane domain-containing protein [Cyclobacteriaceae bacterium]
MERIDENKHEAGRGVVFVIGTLLVMAGLLLIGDQLNLFPFRVRHILISWQMLLIVMGLVFLSKKDGRLTGIILLSIGVFFLLPKLTILPVSAGSLFWPALLLFVGLMILLRGSFTRGLGYSASKNSGDAIEDVNVFGGHDRIIETENFRGGEIVNIFGGGNYDMLQTKLAPGNNVLEIVMVFGGSKIIVPQDWDVKVEVAAVFGGFSDKRIESPEMKRDSSRTLIIKGVAIFGGGELVNFN